MSTQNKIRITIFGMMLITFIIGFIAHRIDKQNEHTLLELAKDELVKATQQAFAERELRVYRPLYDYSNWTEFIDYLQDTSSDWANVNITPILNAFDLDAVWMVTLEGEQIQYTHDNQLEGYTIPPLVLDKLYSKKFLHYYMMYENQPVLIYGATIHTTDDPDRTTVPGGYFFVSKILDQDFVDLLEKLTETKILFANNPNSYLSVRKGVSTHSAINLYNWDDSFTTTITFEKKHPIIEFHRQSTQRMFWLFFISILILYSLLAFFINRWTVQPLKLATAIIRQEDTSKIPALRKKSAEFSAIGKLIERFISQKQELKKAMQLALQSDKLKTAFLNNISHEVRTPLNGIIGASMLLADPDIPTSEKQNLSDLIQLSSQRLVRTITEYMDISLLNSDSMPYYPKMFELGEVLQPIINDFKMQCSIKGLAFHYELENIGNSDTLFNDKALLDKILRHLLENAVTFTHQGHVQLSVKKIDLQLLFEVEDTGIGIQPSFHEKLFNAFEQEDASNVRRYDGSGLGLAIVDKCCKLIGATITFESQKNTGSKFIVTLSTEYKQ